MAVAALVLGILTFVCLGPIAGILAIIFGFLGLGKSKENGVGRGMSIAGIVLGAVGTALSVVLFILLVVVGSTASDRWDDALGTANPADYELSTDSCSIDRSGFVTFDGTIENTADRDLNFNIETEIRDSSSDVLLESPSTFVSVPEGDTVRWSVVASLSEPTDIECSVDSVNNFLN